MARLGMLTWIHSLKQADRSQNLGKLELLPPISFSVSGSERGMGEIPYRKTLIY